jgi:hypothetical protein
MKQQATLHPERHETSNNSKMQPWNERDYNCGVGECCDGEVCVELRERFLPLWQQNLVSVRTLHLYPMQYTEEHTSADKV